MEQSRVAVALGLADAVLLLAASALALTQPGDGASAVPAGATPPSVTEPAAPSPPGPTASVTPSPGARGTSGAAARRSVSREEVAARSWPARMAASGPWSATVAGTGDRVVLTAPGTVVGGIKGATVALGARDPRPSPSTTRTSPASSSPASSSTTNRAVVLPNGARWFPLGLIQLEGSGDVVFTSASVVGPSVSATVPSFESVVMAGKGGLTGLGTFVQAQGAQVDRLAMPPGTKLVELCQEQEGAADIPCPLPAPMPLNLNIVAKPGLTIGVDGTGEVAVAGSVRASALGRSWEGLVVAVEAQRLRGSATSDGDRWTVTAEGAAARQVWVDVWPVVDSKLTARSVVRNAGFLSPRSVRIQWTNVGFATTQILEAEGVGPGAPRVGFDLNKTLGHDADVGVRRGDRVANLAGGGDIDSNLPPGESVDRGLSYAPGAAATVVLRGNFPEVRVPLAIPAT